MLLYLPWKIHMVRTWQFSRKSCEYLSYFNLKHSLPLKNMPHSIDSWVLLRKFSLSSLLF